VDWSTPGFDDSSWSAGAAGFSSGFSSYNEATVLPDPTASYVSVLLRRSFVVTNLAEVVWPALRIDYDDGFVARS
jgi:hypothetical protein